MRSVSGREFCRLLESRGWRLKRVRGSHHINAKRIQPFPETIALLESLGAVNNHRCMSC